VIVLSMHQSEEYALRAVRAGASGYLLKGADVAELEAAVWAVRARRDVLLPGRRPVRDRVRPPRGRAGCSAGSTA